METGDCLNKKDRLTRDEVLNRNPTVRRYRERMEQSRQARQQEQSTTSAEPSAEAREDAPDAESAEEPTEPSQAASGPSRATGRSAAYEANDLRHYGFSQESTTGAETSASATNGTRRNQSSQGNGSAATNASSRPAPAERDTTTGGSPAAVDDASSRNNQPPRSSLNAAREGARAQQGPGQSDSSARETGQSNGGGENAGPTSNQFKPQQFTRAQLQAGDSKLQPLTHADTRLLETYGDTIHLNDGTHLTGTVDPDTDAMWQEIYGNMIAGSLPLYTLPKGKEGNRFMDTLAQIVEDMADGKCNSEMMLCFPALMLIKQFGGRNRNAKAVKELLSQRLDLWDEKRYSALLRNVTDVWNRGNGTNSGVRRNENDKDASLAKKYDAMTKDGRLRNAVRMVDQQSGGGGGGKLYRYNDKDSKSGEPVIDVLRSKFPETVVPEEEDFDPSTSGPPEDTPPIYLNEEDIKLRAKKLNSAAGMDGVDGQTARYWITNFGDRSKRLREALARIAMILANGSPHYAMYRALNDARMLAVDKQPGVRPLACGCIWMRLMAGAVIDSGLKTQARDACGNVQSCAGLGGGIEGNMHAATRIFPESAGWTEGEGTSNAEIAEQLLTQSDEMRSEEGGMDDDEEAEADSTSGTHYEPNTGFGVTLVDADNAFNRTNLYMALETVARRWPAGARFCFNRYRHYHRTYVRTDPGKPPIIILRKEGLAQGCVLAMLIYGIALMPLCEELARAYPEVLRLWFADDAAKVGSARLNAQCLAFLVEHGPKYGYFPKPEKSFHVCKEEDEEVAKAEFQRLDLDLRFVRGSRYLGGHVGSKESKEQFVTSKVEGFCNSVRGLAEIAKTHPQSAHAGFTFCLQHRWQYMSRVMSGIAPLFEPLERVIQEEYIPALLGSSPEELRGAKISRELLALGVRSGGLGIRNPMSTAESQHATSKSLTLELVDSIVRGGDLDMMAHERQMKESRKAARLSREMDEESYLFQLMQRTPSLKNRLVRASNSGTWLSTIPNNLCDNILSAQEWQDNVRLRYGLTPLNLEPICDGCGKGADVEHYLTCPKGGLRNIRHDEVGRTFGKLSKEALSKSYVYREPRIIPSAAQRQTRNANDTGSTSTPSQTRSREDKTRGDVSVYGFYAPGTECIFDVRVTDPSNKSYRKKDPRKVLATQEKEKKDKYLRKCLERRKHFVPLVFSVDGMAGREAKKAMKHLASLLAEKWERPHGQMVHFVKTSVAISLCRSVTLMLRSGRIRGPDRIAITSGDAMECLQTGHDEQL